MHESLTLVLPAWNEEAVIEPVLREIAASNSLSNTRILVVDDGSTDQTAERVRSLGLEIPRLSVRTVPHGGKDRALWWAFRDVQTEWLAILDADGQYVPDDVAHLLDAAIAEHADACWGQRVKRSDHPWRMFCSRIAKSIKRRMLGTLSVEDAGCGTWVARVRYLRPVADRIEHPAGQVHCHLAELVVAQGGTVVQRPIRHRARAGGSAKFGMWNRLAPGYRSLRQARGLAAQFRDGER